MQNDKSQSQDNFFILLDQKINPTSDNDKSQKSDHDNKKKNDRKEQ